jgi:methanogenic corrinoid protein MtbC1
LAAKYLERALSSFDNEAGERSCRLATDTSEGRLAAEYILATLEGDRRRAGRLILDAVDDYTVADLVLRVLLPAQVELGRMWHADEISVAEEHFASNTTKTVMARLMARAEIAPSNGKTMLAAAVAGNQVEIGLQAVADFFEMEGWRAIHLGANVPTDDIVRAVGCFEADLLGLSASQSTQFETVRKTINAVRVGTRGDKVRVIVGGSAFVGSEHLPQQLGADGYAPDPAAAGELGGKLVLGTMLHAD